MASFEYKVVPAPTKGIKTKGLKTPEARFANALEQLMNDLGADGWQYQRADTLPSVERSGLTGSTTNWRHVLVFRKDIDNTPETPVSEEFSGAGIAISEDLPEAEDTAATEDAADEENTTQDSEHPAGRPGATEMLADNGVEETSEVSGMSNSLERLAKARKSGEKSDA